MLGSWFAIAAKGTLPLWLLSASDLVVAWQAASAACSIEDNRSSI